jgi:hypothetical protein
MNTTTIEDQLADLRRRIDRLYAFGRTGAVDRSRIQRHLDALHQSEASVAAAARKAPDELEEKLGQLRTRLAIAEHSVAADISGDWATFAAAVDEELRSWDAYFERLQAHVAEEAWRAREAAEAEIADIRRRRIAVARLAQTNGYALDAQRERVAAARDELEREADELSAKLT